MIHIYVCKPRQRPVTIALVLIALDDEGSSPSVIRQNCPRSQGPKAQFFSKLYCALTTSVAEPSMIHLLPRHKRRVSSLHCPWPCIPDCHQNPKLQRKQRASALTFVDDCGKMAELLGLANEYLNKYGSLEEAKVGEPSPKATFI